MDCVASAAVITTEMKINEDDEGECVAKQFALFGGAETKFLGPHIGEMNTAVSCSCYRAERTCSGGDWNGSYRHIATPALYGHRNSFRVTITVLEKQ
jgi:hypothetical protein